jgi:hypothetical protein
MSAHLYPEIAAAGSLGAALGFPFPVAYEPLLEAAVPSPLPHRGALEVSAYRHERRWSIHGGSSRSGAELIGGNTTDFAEVVRVAAAWHAGLPLAEIVAVASFAEPSGRFEVPDCDPVLLTESEWLHYRKKSAELAWPEAHLLIEAAYAEPALRRLYPFTSHWLLRFSTTTHPVLTKGVPVSLNPVPLEVRLETEVLCTAATAEEAVALALPHLPADLGPVTFGGV